MGGWAMAWHGVAVPEGKTRANKRSQEGQGAGGGERLGLGVCCLTGSLFVWFSCSTNKTTKQTDSLEAAKLLHLYVKSRRLKRRAFLMYLVRFRLKGKISAFRCLLRRAFRRRAFSNIYLTSLHFARAIFALLLLL